ncbi:MAG: PAAR domain-containing protein [Gammaproteobacteria bacterium]|nr:PAAR domain-containing protein [Gammaproteobacteria bacterium]
MKPLILQGDTTSHGGSVVEGATTTRVNNRPVARVSDRVICPHSGHSPAVIVTGDTTTLVEGRAVARHGDRCSCGATLIASVADTGILS